MKPGGTSSRSPHDRAKTDACGCQLKARRARRQILLWNRIGSARRVLRDPFHTHRFRAVPEFASKRRLWWKRSIPESGRSRCREGASGKMKRRPAGIAAAGWEEQNFGREGRTFRPVPKSGCKGSRNGNRPSPLRLQPESPAGREPARGRKSPVSREPKP